MPKTRMFLSKCGKGSILKMNKKQYNNVIEHTLKNEQTDDSLRVARAYLTIWVWRYRRVI